MDLENGVYLNQRKKESWKTVLTLAYQSLGVVYGDLSISPLYVYKSTFEEDIEHSETNEEIFGVLSFIFWTLTLVPLLKYVFIVLRADDNGEGGTFALYSLLCRHAKVSSLPSCQLVDGELSAYKKDTFTGPNTTAFGSKLKSTLEKHRVLQRFLLVLALLGACMVIGDGILTPAISVTGVIGSWIIYAVFSAVSGVELAMSKEHHKCKAGDSEVDKSSRERFMALSSFRPVSEISGIGFSPMFALLLSSLEECRELYAYYCMLKVEVSVEDGVKIAFTSIVYPSLILAYMGQAAYLSRHHNMETDYRVGFYVSVPGFYILISEKLRWPVLGIAILAAVVGSQAIITGTFSIIKQCSALGCFPRVKIVHTSSSIHGQIYIPEINWILMTLCLAVTIGFRDTRRLGNASGMTVTVVLPFGSGLAVITVMLVTTCLMSLVIVLCWHQSVVLALCFVFFFGTIEALYFSASLIKFLEGAWVPVALALIFMMVMYIWHFGTLKKYECDVQSKVSVDWLLSLGPSLGIVRVRGIGLVHTELVSGIPAIFSHFVTNLPAFHQVLVFLCVKSVPIPHVKHEERFLVGHIGPREYRLYRCIVRYGYRDAHKDDVEFENDLVCSIAEFIRTGKASSSDIDAEMAMVDEKMTVVGTPSTHLEGIQMRADNVGNTESAGTSELKEIQSPQVVKPRKRVRFVVPDSPKIDTSAREELRELMEAREAGVAYILGHSYVRAKQGSGLLKKFAINIGYDFLRRNCRAPSFALSVPPASTLEVGMVYHV
ncbi:hypothetical protein RJ640_016170 [Escallonia rubra]|uniref:Potassium transporter n=1 Tax=Escallonia rubra TaxID=112253 RepID=A0AA88RRI2_9ASTE|nr:hypothetical protein RJ640_016170 [Escallonia rubra]